MNKNTLITAGAAVLLLFFLIAQQILVFNAEALVALAFVVFVYLLVTKTGKQAGESLDEKRNEIEAAYEESKNLEKEYIQRCLNFYLTQKETLKDLETFGVNVSSQLRNVFVDRKAAYETTVLSQVETQLAKLRDSEQRSVEAFQRTFIDTFTNAAIENATELKFSAGIDAIDTTFTTVLQAIENTPLTSWTLYKGDIVNIQGNTAEECSNDLMEKSTHSKQPQGTIWTFNDISDNSDSFTEYGPVDSLSTDVFHGLLNDPKIEVQLYNPNINY